MWEGFGCRIKIRDHGSTASFLPVGGDIVVLGMMTPTVVTALLGVAMKAMEKVEVYTAAITHRENI
jgi:hypothetical protein